MPLLEREHPQAIALVLAHLPAERAGHVLARLPAAMQTDVIRRLVDLEETDPHVVRDVERAVAAWLNRRQPARRRVAGMEAVSAILNASDGSARRQILNNLATHNRPLAHKLTPPAPTPRRFSFAEVCDLPWNALERIIRAADRRSVVLALAGAAADVVQDILDQLRVDEARLAIAPTIALRTAAAERYRSRPRRPGGVGRSVVCRWSFARTERFPFDRGGVRRR